MSIKYINRQHTSKGNPGYPCAQLVNVPELEGTLRCRFCVHGMSHDTILDYLACIEKNKCGHESLLYAPLYNSLQAPIVPTSPHFSPAPVIKSVTIDSMTRYIQLWSCDLDGYQCCRLCQFYAARVAADQTISDCSNTHACGRNGSWWDLLQIRDTILYDLPDIYEPIRMPNNYRLLDGTALNDVTPVTATRQSDNLIMVQMSNGQDYYICNMLNQSPRAWFLLASQYVDPLTWSFMIPIYWRQLSPSNVIMFQSPSQALYRFLINYGMDDTQFEKPVGTIAWVNDSTATARLFTQITAGYSQVSTTNYKFLTINDAKNYEDFALAIGDNLTFLTLPYKDATPARATKHKFKTTPTLSVPYIVVTDYDSAIRLLLESLGVRPSVFYNL